MTITMSRWHTLHTMLGISNLDEIHLGETLTGEEETIVAETIIEDDEEVANNKAIRRSADASDATELGTWQWIATPLYMEIQMGTMQV